MSDNKRKNVLETVKYINESHSRFKTLMNKEELTDADKSELNVIAQNSEQIKVNKNTIKFIPSKTISALNTIFYNHNGYVIGLDYTPERINNETKTYSNDNGNSLLINHNNNIENNKIIGISKKTKGINDDVTNFDGQPNIIITKQSSRSIHTTPVGTEYVISFEFSLSRFPSKVYQNSNKNHQMKQITTRISELICFQFANNKLIEFAAMAPNGLGIDGNKTKFKNRYSPFSIAVSFPHGKVKHSIHTDYKFELNKTYLVKLVIQSLDGIISNSTNLSYKLYVNEIQELVVFTRCKVWGSAGKNLKKLEIIPSQPGFLTMSNQKYSQTQYNNYLSSEHLSFSPPMSLDYLIAIYSVPYLVSSKPYYGNFIEKKYYWNNIIYKRYLHKSNTAVNFGKINIFYLTF